MVVITPVPTSSDSDDESGIPVVLPENLSDRFQRLIGRNIDPNRLLPAPPPNPPVETTAASLETVNMSDPNNPSPADGLNPDGTPINPMFTPGGAAPTGTPPAPATGGMFPGFGAGLGTPILDYVIRALSCFYSKQ